MTLNHVVQAILAHLTIVRTQLIDAALELSIVDASLCIVTLAVDKISAFVSHTGALQIQKPAFKMKEK
jgi:hypothetical protein